ncbi:MAG: polysaccharide deacetylase family protein [Tissierellia bacterium]|nr:polysaccharide deacetylase family protein [Tissierellia bacterium]
MKKKVIILLLVFLLSFPVSVSAVSEIATMSVETRSKILDGAKTISRQIADKYVFDEQDEYEEVTDLYPDAKKIPILMFHEVGYMESKEFNDSNYILKASLESKMLYLSSNGYTTITMADLYDNWTKGTKLPEKPVILTFDDGYASHFTYVKDVLDRFNAKGTFYIVQDRLFMGIENRNLDGVKALHEAGQEIGVHSYSHPDFSKMTYDEIYKEVSTSKTFLEDNLGIKLSTFSYPYGNYNNAAIKVLKDLGFKTSVTTKRGIGDPNQFPEDAQYKISRYNVDFNTDENRFIQMLEGTYK